MRTIGIALILAAVGLLIRFVGLLNCKCADVTPFDFVIVAIVIVGGFAVMLPDRRE